MHTPHSLTTGLMDVNKCQREENDLLDINITQETGCRIRGLDQKWPIDQGRENGSFCNQYIQLGGLFPSNRLFINY